MTYYCSPYHVWKKINVENINEIIKKFFLSKTGFDTIKEEKLNLYGIGLTQDPR